MSEETTRAGSGLTGNGAGIDPAAAALMAGVARKRGDHYRDLCPAFKSHELAQRLNFKGGAYV
jgi:hypothetical protein